MSDLQEMPLVLRTIVEAREQGIRAKARQHLETSALENDRDLLKLTLRERGQTITRS